MSRVNCTHSSAADGSIYYVLRLESGRKIQMNEDIFELENHFVFLKESSLKIRSRSQGEAALQSEGTSCTHHEINFTLQNIAIHIFSTLLVHSVLLGN